MPGDRGITANAIRAGVTDTPALRKIPGAENMIAEAERLNPYQRLTTPEDVARCMVALADERTYSEGQVKTRLDAFMERLLARREGERREIRPS